MTWAIAYTFLGPSKYHLQLPNSPKIMDRNRRWVSLQVDGDFHSSTESAPAPHTTQPLYSNGCASTLVADEAHTPSFPSRPLESLQARPSVQLDSRIDGRNEGNFRRMRRKSVRFVEQVRVLEYLFDVPVSYLFLEEEYTQPLLDHIFMSQDRPPMYRRNEVTGVPTFMVWR